MADTRKTPIFDYDAGEFSTGVGNTVTTAVGAEAVAHIALKALNTALGKYSVYADYENIQKNHIYGSRVHDVAVRQELSEDVRISEIERETKEALLYDTRIKSVDSVTVYKQLDENGEYCYYTDVTLTTYFGKNYTLEGVKANG